MHVLTRLLKLLKIDGLFCAVRQQDIAFLEVFLDEGCFSKFDGFACRKLLIMTDDGTTAAPPYQPYPYQSKPYETLH